MNSVKQSIVTGSVSGLLGALCCVTPLILVLVGLSGVTGAMALAGTLQQSFRWTVFIPLAVLFLVIALYIQIYRKEGQCGLREAKKYKWFVLMTLVFSLIVWVLLLYVIVPLGFRLVS